MLKTCGVKSHKIARDESCLKNVIIRVQFCDEQLYKTFPTAKPILINSSFLQSLRNSIDDWLIQILIQINLRTSFPRCLSWREAVVSTAESPSVAFPRSLVLFALRALSLLVQRLFGPTSASSRLVLRFRSYPSRESIQKNHDWFQNWTAWEYQKRRKNFNGALERLDIFTISCTIIVWVVRFFIILYVHFTSKMKNKIFLLDQRSL